MSDETPDRAEETTRPTGSMLQPRDELQALCVRLMKRGDVTVTEFMLQGRWIKVRVNVSGRHVSAKRLGINWLVWLDGAQLQRVKSGELATTFKATLTAARKTRG